MNYTYENIPTYYVELIKKGQREIEHITCRINQLCGCLQFAEQNKNQPRIAEIKDQITELAKQKAHIREKLERYTKCQCSMCN
jgi:DNA-binding transcriptional regulator GbsR (MarR family)